MQNGEYLFLHIFISMPITQDNKLCIKMILKHFQMTQKLLIV